MNYYERESKIFEIISQEKSVSVNKLVRMLYFSPATIRRDLKAMENKGLIKRVHGGAILFVSPNEETSVILREESFKKEKKEICQACSGLIKNNQSMFLDSSSTVCNLIPLLNEFKSLTIVTNGLNAALKIGQTTKFKAYVPNGFVKIQSNSIIGETAYNTLSKLYCDLFIFSCAGLSIENGITEQAIEQAEIKSIMAKRSKKKILLVDSSKFEKTYIVRAMPLEDVDVVITDKRPDDKFVDFCQNAKIELIICEK